MTVASLLRISLWFFREALRKRNVTTAITGITKNSARASFQLMDYHDDDDSRQVNTHLIVVTSNSYTTRSGPPYRWSDVVTSFPDRRIVKELNVQRLHMVIQIIANRIDNLLPHVAQENTAGKTRHQS